MAHEGAAIVEPYRSDHGVRRRLVVARPRAATITVMARLDWPQLLQPHVRGLALAQKWCWPVRRTYGLRLGDLSTRSVRRPAARRPIRQTNRDYRKWHFRRRRRSAPGVHRGSFAPGAPRHRRRRRPAWLT